MRKGIREMTDQELIAAREAGEITASACVVEQERRAAAASPPPIVEGWTLDRVMLKPGAALEELLYYKRRVQELLETTNRYLERARRAEAPAEARHGAETFSRAQMLAEVDRRVERALAAMAAISEARAEPVAWRCKDFADGWILDHNEHSAREYQRKTGCVVQPLYTAPPAARTADRAEQDGSAINTSGGGE